ncbi:MAG: hypothetical protein JRI25_08835 [Deltaproteobacteria bacterium]|nr:hypothetical protein [Deltaproteobacteria bacterium]
MTLLLAWMAAALAGPCAQPSTSSMLAQTLAKADSAFVEMDLTRFEETHFTASRQLECLEELVNPADAAAYHRLEALAAFVAEDDHATRASFRASLSIQPLFTLPERIAPPGNPLDALYGETAAMGPSPTALLTPPPDLVLYVDGARSDIRATEQPFILQGAALSGQIGHTGYVPEGNPIPAWASAARPEETPPPPPEPVPQNQAKGALFIASGTTIAIAGVLYGYAWGSRGLYDDPNASLEELDALRARTNTATVTSLVVGSVGAGLMVVAVVVP